MARIERGHPGHETLGHIRSRVQGDSRGDGFLVFYAHANGPPRFIVGAATPGALSKTIFFFASASQFTFIFFCALSSFQGVPLGREVFEMRRMGNAAVRRARNILLYASFRNGSVR